MSKKRNAGIIAYGTEEDREKLAILADTYRMSGSEWIVKTIRDRFAELFGGELEHSTDNRHMSGETSTENTA